VWIGNKVVRKTPRRKKENCGGIECGEDGVSEGREKQTAGTFGLKVGVSRWVILLNEDDDRWDFSTFGDLLLKD
jgi:hypothetical protein